MPKALLCSMKRALFCTVFRDNFASPVLPLDMDLTLETLPRERRALEGVGEREKE